MSELQKAVSAFSGKVDGGLKNVRFFTKPGVPFTAMELAAEINRMDDAVAEGLCRHVVNPDEELPAAKSSLSSILEADGGEK